MGKTLRALGARPGIADRRAGAIGRQAELSMYICQICKKALATIHLTDIHNNVKKEMHICEACAAEKGFNMQSAASLPHLLGMAAGKKSAPQPAGKTRVGGEDDIVCPKCGTRWSDFKNKGRLGCPDDYRAFRERLEPLIANQLPGLPAESAPFHRGKTPGKRNPPDAARRAIRELEIRLRQAVAREHYEEAARLKARIAELEARRGVDGQ